MASTTAEPGLGLIPPRRLGALLERARLDAHWTHLEVAVASGGRFSAGELRDIEAGRGALPDEGVRALTELYGIELGTLVPQRSRLVIDRSERAVTAPRDRDETDRHVLLRYLALVHHLRGATPGRRIVLRAADVDVLAEFLGATAESVHDALLHIMEHARRDLARAVQAVAGRPSLPGLGLLVALTTDGALLLVRPDA